MEKRQYLCIDLKSFYASVECVERGLDPMTTNLVVADPERKKGTICLAITPSMKAKGIKNRCRVYEIPDTIPYIMASPRMKLYIQYSADIYAVYLKYVAKEDIHVYSIDEAFLDVTDYHSLYQWKIKEFAAHIMEDIKKTTGITAVAGIGTNLYLAKVALDITAKHDKDNIGYLNEELYRTKLWRHRPLTDFWRIGVGMERTLRNAGLLTMEDIAHTRESILYRMFGIDAELLIDHAWGKESTTIADIKAYQPKSSSLSRGQVLLRNYSWEEGILIVKEMLDELCLEMADAQFVTESITLELRYSYETGGKPTGGTTRLMTATNSYQSILPSVLDLYRNIVNREQPLRKITITCNRIREEGFEQITLFTNYEQVEKEKKIQKAALDIKQRFGKNALLRGMDLLEESTARKRNQQIGGHKSGE